MKILSAEEIRLWDQYTIINEPISSINLMERAALSCLEWMIRKYPDPITIAIFCGKGNNGGDGLAIGRMLIENGYDVHFYILEFGFKGTEDFQENLERLHLLSNPSIHFIQSSSHFPELQQNKLIIDAVLGSGLNRRLDGITAELIEYINNANLNVISIDIPSGLFCDRSSLHCSCIKATYTLTFQCYKLAFLFAENKSVTGEIHVLDIGLHKGFYEKLHQKFSLLDDVIIHSTYRPRNKFAHKGNFGHALLIAGSYGKMGAVVLSATAALRSGIGLLTCHIPSCGYTILQTAVPEAMVITDANSDYTTEIEADILKYSTIGIGPGIGTNTATENAIFEIFKRFNRPIVIDADAINILARNKELVGAIPPGSILTPHPKEFERLFGKSDNEFEAITIALEQSKKMSVIIILKGHYTFVALPDGRGFFNSTGNAGMATAGSGDVLTGILTGLLAQGYQPEDAATLGVYLHGVAGDLAAKQFSKEGMIAGDIIKNLGNSFLQIQ